MIVEAGAHSVRVVLEAGAHLHVAAFVLAVEQAARLSIEVDIEGEGAEFHFNALFVARGTEEAVINVRVNHMVPGCVSRQLIKGIVADAATGSFTGMVHVAPGAMGTYAVQRNQNLQLTDTAHVFTRPQLEIYADDVRCSHGATVGRLDPEAIYYMRQRGVSEVEARRLQMQGFVDEIVNHCPSEAFRKSISMRIGTLIDRL
jgi:Fe-S cluster assembly protein SufD